MATTDPKKLFDQQMSIISGNSVLFEMVKDKAGPPIKTAPNTRNTIFTLAALGMGNGLAEMIDDYFAGKKVMPKYSAELRRECTAAIEMWGRIDLRESGPDGQKNLWVSKRIARLDALWREHRQSVLVYVSMLIPMLGDASMKLRQAKRPDQKKIESLAGIDEILVKIFRYYEQRGKAHDELVNYGAALYRKWAE